MLVEKMETLKVLDGELAEIVPDDEETQRADEYKEGVYRVLAKLNKALGPIVLLHPLLLWREPSPYLQLSADSLQLKPAIQ